MNCPMCDGTIMKPKKNAKTCGSKECVAAMIRQTREARLAAERMAFRTALYGKKNPWVEWEHKALYADDR